MFCDGKARQPGDGTNGSELKLQFACNFAFSLRTFAENHLPSSISVSPYVSETNRSAIFEITRNFQLMFWDCQCDCEFRSQTRCSQIAVLSLSSPNQVHSGEVGRPRFDIREETLVELRSLGFSWEDVARMLLVSRWTVQRRVSEFGLSNLSCFSDLTDEQLDSKVTAF